MSFRLNGEDGLKADPFQIGDVLKNPRRFVVPIYQRTYAWKTKPHLETFIEQVKTKAEERLSGNGHYPHYMGALLVIPRGSYAFGRIEVLDVVDGQQRLSTFQIFLSALRDIASSMKQTYTADLLGSLLLNPEGPQLREPYERYKLYPTAYDRKLIFDLVDLDWDGLIKKYPGSFYKNGRVVESAALPLRAWGFFRTEIESFINGSEAQPFDDAATEGGTVTTISRANVPLGDYSGQKALIVSYLKQADAPLSLDQMVEELTPRYEPLINEWAKTQAGGVRGSIRFHLRALQKLGQIKITTDQVTPTAAGGNAPNAVPSEETRIARLNALSGALLESFQVIVITLGEHDDAQVIFETLNAGGEPLAAMDLVRNDVFHRAVRAGENVELLMENRWKAFEEPFWKEAGIRGRIKKPRIDFYLSDTLAAETGSEILLTELYARYKSFVAARNFPNVDSELETLLEHAPTYRSLVKPAGTDGLAEMARELSVFDVTTAYPLVFVIQASGAPEAEKEVLYQLIVSYVVRRLLCGLTAKNYNKVFLRLANELRTKGVSLAIGTAAFSTLDGDTTRFPPDQEFRNAFLLRRQYGNIQQHRLQHILSKLENQSRNKFDEATSLPTDLTIEHVLPDAWCKYWPLPDGTMAAPDLISGMNESQLKQIAEREALKHTLGNLTLLTESNNPSLGHSGFSEKKERLKKSLLKLNHEIAENAAWGEEQIRIRAKHLADLAIQVWIPLALGNDE